MTNIRINHLTYKTIGLTNITIDLCQFLQADWLTATRCIAAEDCSFLILIGQGRVALAMVGTLHLKFGLKVTYLPENAME